MRAKLIQMIREFEKVDRKIADKSVLRHLNQKELKELRQTHEHLEYKLSILGSENNLYIPDQIHLAKEAPAGLSRINNICSEALDVLCKQVVEEYGNSYVARLEKIETTGINDFFKNQINNINNASPYFIAKMMETDIIDDDEIYNTIIETSGYKSLLNEPKKTIIKKRV